MPTAKVSRQGKTDTIKGGQYAGLPKTGVQFEGKGDQWYDLLGEYAYSQLMGKDITFDIVQENDGRDGRKFYTLKLSGDPPPKPASGGGGARGYGGRPAPVAKPWADLERVVIAAAALATDFLGDDGDSNGRFINTVVMAFARGEVAAPQNTATDARESPQTHVSPEASPADAADMFGAPGPSDEDALPDDLRLFAT